MRAFALSSLLFSSFPLAGNRQEDNPCARDVAAPMMGLGKAGLHRTGNANHRERLASLASVPLNSIRHLDTTMPFTRKVEIGAIALCNFGPDAGKLYAISDVLDLNYVRLKPPMGFFRLFESRRCVAGAGVRSTRQNADGRRRRREFHCLLVSRTRRAVLALRGRHAVSRALKGRPADQASSCAARSRFDVSTLCRLPSRRRPARSHPLTRLPANSPVSHLAGTRGPPGRDPSQDELQAADYHGP